MTLETLKLYTLALCCAALYVAPFALGSL